MASTVSILGTDASPGAAATAAALPKLDADALDGTRVHLPAAANGAPLALVIGYDRRAASATQQWSHALLAALKARAAAYAVVVASGTPFFVHRAIRGDVSRSAPASYPQHESNVLLTFDNRGWKDLVPPGKPEDPGIVIVDAADVVVYAKREAFADAAVVAAARALGSR